MIDRCTSTAATGAFPMARVMYLVLVLTGLFPVSAGAAFLSDSDVEYLGILGQKGTQIIADIAKGEDALDRRLANGSDLASAYCLEKLKNDMGLVTLEGDHLQSVVAIARRMVDPKDEEIALLFVKTIAAAALRKVQPLRNDVNTVSGVCPAGTLMSAKVTQVLSFMDEFANVVDSIAHRTK
jgi:hypothetical protein